MKYRYLLVWQTAAEWRSYNLREELIRKLLFAYALLLSHTYNFYVVIEPAKWQIFNGLKFLFASKHYEASTRCKSKMKAWYTYGMNWHYPFLINWFSIMLYDKMYWEQIDTTTQQTLWLFLWSPNYTYPYYSGWAIFILMSKVKACDGILNSHSKEYLLLKYNDDWNSIRWIKTMKLAKIRLQNLWVFMFENRKKKNCISLSTLIW